MHKLEIPEEAIGATMRQALSQVVETVYQQMRTQISVKDIRETGIELLKSEDLRTEMSVHQAFLTMDLYEIQRQNWADLLKSDKESLNEVLALRKAEINSLKEKERLFREVELAEIEVHKRRAEEDWDIALLRFHKIKGHLFAGAIILVAGIFIGQAINSIMQPAPQPTHRIKSIGKHK